MNQSNAQVVFGEKLRNTVKNGGTRLNALLAITSRSLLTDEFGGNSNLFWGVYPSSQSANNDSEVLSDFTHRLRTTVSRVRFAERNQPLFIRHAHSIKRSMAKGIDRTDPTDQIRTLRLNPHYRRSVVGRHVVVIDDCTTYGVSFGVAAAFLRKAGASKVTGVALGKFGHQLRYVDIDINTDPFKVVPPGGFAVKPTVSFPGSDNSAAQQNLLTLVM